MKEKNFSELTDQELLIEKKMLQKSKIQHALIIGFLFGILIFGFVSWILFSEKRFGFLVPMLIPITLLYRMLKNPNNNTELERVLKERNLN